MPEHAWVETVVIPDHVMYACACGCEKLVCNGHTVYRDCDARWMMPDEPMPLCTAGGVPPNG